MEKIKFSNPCFMLYLPCRFFTSFSMLLFIGFLPGCASEEEKISDDYNNYRFDQRVIAKLPVYDSLALAIIENFSAFKKFIRDEDSYRSFRYMPSSNEPEVFIKLPPEAAPKIEPYYTRLGSDFIYGFDVFKDSTIKIYVRAGFSSKSKVDIWENLSWYPAGTNIKQREFPDKDSLLNKNWQYWTRFRRRGLFFDN